LSPLVPARYRAPGFDRGVGALVLAVAVDVLRGEVACLAVGVVGDAEGEGAGAADGGDDAAEDDILAVERRAGPWKGAWDRLFSASRSASGANICDNSKHPWRR
jgi:hypothetical protein